MPGMLGVSSWPAVLKGVADTYHARPCIPFPSHMHRRHMRSSRLHPHGSSKSRAEADTTGRVCVCVASWQAVLDRIPDTRQEASLLAAGHEDLPPAGSIGGIGGGPLGGLLELGHRAPRLESLAGTDLAEIQQQHAIQAQLHEPACHKFSSRPAVDIVASEGMATPRRVHPILYAESVHDENPVCCCPSALTGPCVATTSTCTWR